VEEDCRRLDVGRIVRLGAIREGAWTAGSWIWGDRETGEKKSSIGYEADARDPGGAFLRPHCTFTQSGEQHDCRMPLVHTRPHYGGVRFWVLCPVTRHRVAKYG
jgi:hypothetical protein